MAEDNGLAGAVADPESGAITHAPTIIGEDGKFAENWHETLPEDIREEKSLRDFKDVAGLAKSFVTTKRMLGKNKIAIPNETATDAEWDEVYSALGRPTTPDDYGLKKPEDMPDEVYSEEVAKKAMQLFHKIGLNRKQAEALFAFNNENAMAAYKDMAEQEEHNARELADSLHQEWGRAYDQKVHLGNMAVEQGSGGNAEFKDRLVGRFGNDPDFIRFAANLGAKFAEHGVKGAPIPTPSELDDKIHDAMMKEDYMNRNHPGHQKAVENVQRMFKEKHGSGLA